MRAIITKPVVDNTGFTIFSVGQTVKGKLMAHTAPDEQWADVGAFIVKVDGFEYAVECGYFKRPFRMRIEDFLSRE